MGTRVDTGAAGSAAPLGLGWTPQVSRKASSALTCQLVRENIREYPGSRELVSIMT